jgi:hypothetical protein
MASAGLALRSCSWYCTNSPAEHLLARGLLLEHSPSAASGSSGRSTRSVVSGHQHERILERARDHDVLVGVRIARERARRNVEGAVWLVAA